MWFSIALLNYARPSLKKKVVHIAAYVVLKPYILFSIDSAFQMCLPDVQAANAIGSNAILKPQRCRLLNCVLKTSWMLFLLMSLQDLSFFRNFRL